MALHLERAASASRFEHQIDRISNTVNRRCEISCRFPNHGQGEGGHFERRRLRCPNPVPRESFHTRRVNTRATTTPAATTPPKSLSDYILDSLSSYLLSRAKELLGSTEFDQALHWLPPQLLEQLHRKQSFATLLVREGLVFGTLVLMYYQVNNSCRGLCRVVSATRGVPPATDPEYLKSMFYAGTAPLRLLITVWASTRMLRIITVSAHLQQFVGTDIFVKARGIGIVVSGTWFLFRWKQQLTDDLIAKHKIDEPRVLAFDRLVSLVLYFVAAICIADVLGFALRSLLAVGGISGIALGLAAKEVVSNIFGGAVIFITRPFVIGERIKAGAVSGQVQDIGYLQTKILGFDGVPLLVPNQTFINQVITNFSRANSKLLEASFYLHNQDIFLVDNITAQVVEYLKTHPQVESQRATPMCYLKDMGHWGPEISIMCTINFGGGGFFAVRQEIMVKVANIIVDVLGEEAPYFRNSVTNLMWELRMHLLYAGQGLQPGNG